MVKKTKGILGVNPKKSRVPFCGIQITLNRYGWKTKAVFHPLIFGVAS
jgi:hypothetical protein